ncbi:uncharacterized protein DSM5745_08390 [Aspergillus mulundensis]|uniref:Galactosyl transferase GMA12/MNN10 family protein n=1 Tax=Aspergillus mulundensis TaxID=1810919 RepID=A0A3D8RA02_9EURO|nr:hypothetical protein DSM5745_08390 [Aspergillus mulundensis]RDW70879.1 hypothetical protein DSM5745_08390 [Aspergillus mulundensis]
MVAIPHLPMHLQPRRRRLPLIVILIISLVFVLGFRLCSGAGRLSGPWRIAPPSLSLSVPPRGRRITKASMLYGPRNAIYERALQSHARHAERWGYGMEVLRHEIAEGYWNKPSYLLALVIRELGRAVGERVEWFMWVDADSIIINPLIPLELFLPPDSSSPSSRGSSGPGPGPLDTIHLVATKDHKGLNTGIFFIRVHEWSVRFLIESLAYPTYNPSTDLGVQVDQSAMERVLNGSAYRGNVTYLPRPWINAYEWKHAFEGRKGDMLVHFPGLDGERWAHMRRWLDVVEVGGGGWSVPVEQTGFGDGARVFWERVERGRRIVERFGRGSGSGTGEGRKTGKKGKEREMEMEMAVEELKHVLYEQPYQGELLQQRIEAWRRISAS